MMINPINLNPQPLPPSIEAAIEAKQLAKIQELESQAMTFMGMGFTLDELVWVKYEDGSEEVTLGSMLEV
jgi:hypothetical protein